MFRGSVCQSERRAVILTSTLAPLRVSLFADDTLKPFCFLAICLLCFERTDVRTNSQGNPCRICVRSSKSAHLEVPGEIISSVRGRIQHLTEMVTFPLLLVPVRT